MVGAVFGELRTCRLTFVAPHIVNDVSYVRSINHEIDFSWQAQILVNVVVCDV